MKSRHLAIILCAIALLATGCKSKDGQKILPSISGKAGEVAVVCSKVEWESEPGSTLRALLGGEVPYLPQVEPMYDLFNVPQQAFNRVFQVHRNIIVINTEKKFEKSRFTTWTDVWASPQVVIQIDAEDGAKAAEVVAKEGKKILALLERTERNRIISNINSFENAELRKPVNEMFGGSPRFPKGFSMKKIADDFMWISYEPAYTIQGILIWKYPYTGEADFNDEVLAAKRNEITKEQIPCTTEGSYMILNPDIMPGCNYFDYKGRSITELRGLWEAYNDFMGGPFISHSFLSPDKQYVVTLDGFVYAPKYDKRNYLRQVEAILYTFEWNNIPGGE